MGKYDDLDSTVFVGDPDPAGWASKAAAYIKDLDARVSPLDGGAVTPATSRTNLFSDPMATATTRWGGALNYTPSLVTNFPVPAALQDLLGPTTTAIRNTRTATGASRLLSPILTSDMPVNGEPLTYAILARAGKATTVNLTARPQVANSASAATLGSVEVTTEPQLLVVQGASYNTGTAGGASAGISQAVGTITSVTADDWVEIAFVDLEAALVAIAATGAERPIWGGRADTAAANYDWAGTANDSKSTQTAGTGVTPSGSAINGFLYPEAYGANATSDATAAIVACATAASAANKGIWLSQNYRVSSPTLADLNVYIDGPGALLNTPGNMALFIKHTPAETISSGFTLGTGWFGVSSAADESNESEKVTTITTTTQAALASFVGEDEWSVSSRNWYALTGRTQDGNSDALAQPVASRVYYQDWFTIRGIVIPYTTAGAGIKEGDIITGATSGFSARVLSVSSAAGQILVRKFTGSLASTGETLYSNGGTTSVGVRNGNAYAITRRKLDYSDAGFTNTVVLEKGRKLRTTIKRLESFAVNADGSTPDPMGVYGSASRKFSFGMARVVNFDVSGLDLHDTWDSAVNFHSCYKGFVRMSARDVPNLAWENGQNVPKEGVYGYGLEVIGACAEIYAHIDAENVRHAFTTNGYEVSGTVYPSDKVQLTGFGRDIVITGTASDTAAAAWDNHEGFLRLHYWRCRALNPSKGVMRYASGGPALQDRSISTTITDFYSEDSTGGIHHSSASHALNTGIRDEFVVRGAKIMNYTLDGIVVSQATHPTSVHTVDIQDNLLVTDGLTRPAGGTYNQSGITCAGVPGIIANNTIKKSNSDGILFTGAPAARVQIIVSGNTFDYSQSAPSSSLEAIRNAIGSNIEIILGGGNVVRQAVSGGVNYPTAMVSLGNANPILTVMDPSQGAFAVTTSSSTFLRYKASGGTPTIRYGKGVSTRTTYGATNPPDGITGDVNVQPPKALYVCSADNGAAAATWV